VNLKTALALGRVSNLPTVWTNVLAGAALAGGLLSALPLLCVMLALSSFYIGGMYLNDAFDRGYDAQHQPRRPIPSGRASARSVFAVGFGLLALGVLGVVWQARATDSVRDTAISAFSLCALIVFYDLHHKGNRWSPLVMGGCRVLSYVTAGLALGGVLAWPLAIGSAVLLAYLIALTFIAKRGGGPTVVGRLLAGICLVDAAVLLLAGQPMLAALAAVGFPLTRALHRWVAGP
jgi:4-hydroxybenzoate polyprenyltransferase